jgi:predicted enzyme related to lactoylglutathione lyase
MNGSAPSAELPPTDHPSPDQAQHPVGGICWIDLGVPDVQVATDFYSGLLGWQVAPPDHTGYRLASLAGHFIAAFGPAEDSGLPYWTVYVHTADAAVSAQLTVQAGGTLVAPPTPAGEAGIAAVIRTPGGARLSLWQPGTHTGTWASGHPGTLADCTLRITNDDHAFLHTVLGWRLDPDGVMTGPNGYVGRWTSHGAETATPEWLVTFHVEDTQTATQRATALGARAHGRRPEILTDPSGATFTITSRRHRTPV